MVTAEQVIAEVRRLAAEQPDFVYGAQEGAGGNCSYFGCAIGDTSGQACIVGQALAGLNVDMSGLLETEKTAAGVTAGGALRRRMVDVAYTESEASWLTEVQYLQDADVPWGEAVAKADQSVKL